MKKKAKKKVASKRPRESGYYWMRLRCLGAKPEVCWWSNNLRLWLSCCFSQMWKPEHVDLLSDRLQPPE